VLLTFLFCVLYLPGPSSAQRAKDNVAGVIYETENNTGGQEGKRTGGISRASNDNVAGEMYQPETNTGGQGKSQAGGDKEKKIPAPDLPGVSGNKPGIPALQQGIQSADSMSVSGQQTGSTGSVLLCNEIPGFNVSAGATYFTKKTNVYYHGGTVLLAAQPDGTGNISVDDALEIIVTHEDGTNATLSYVFAIRYHPWMISSPPMDITHLFKEGLNSFYIRLYDIYGGMAGSSSLWITSVSLPVSGSDAAANIALLNHDDREESFISDPVDSATGAHVIRRSLMGVNGAVPIDFRVHYNSLLLKEGSMGRGWGHDHQARLEVLANGNIDLRWTANRVNHFTSSGAASTNPPTWLPAMTLWRRMWTAAIPLPERTRVFITLTQPDN